ncbi:hypothetical protein IPA_09040 [Ignicoccus pacificus DSM 13166]|uniref:Uncharacterized protein n=1 Tax=Ignicoccus pacificus DSM 13166 TaxID=940294 RepID=A0A977PLB0_9CREN|nr:hypothetical protein IPA_09040 [Ignicoccus pacificus DSM 13166]
MKKWVPVAIFALTLLLSIALSPWWNPWTYSLSALGSASNSLGGVLFDGGVALTGFSISHLNLKNFAQVVMILAILSLLVGAINIDFGIYHYVVSVLLFIMIYVYVLLHGTPLAYAGTLGSVSLWISHWYLGLPPGVAIPELSAIALAFYFLMKDST